MGTGTFSLVSVRAFRRTGRARTAPALGYPRRPMIPIRDSNPTRSTPVVNYLLIGLNAAAFLVQLWLMNRLGDVSVVAGYGLVPARIANDPAGEAFTIFT